MATRRLTKPKCISSDPYRAKKWNEIVRGRDFGPEDVPTLTLLVQWHQVVDKCIEDLSLAGGGIRVAQSNDKGEARAMPQIATMKQASAEIRQLNKQLGIKDGRDVGGAAHGAGNRVGQSRLQVIQGRRDERKRRTA